MMWVLFIVLSARGGVSGNTEGGVATQVIEFRTEQLCREAAKEILTTNDNRVLHITATCVKRWK